MILDNSSTHKAAAVKEWLGKQPRFKLHFTPTSASWLNAVEGWFAQLERRAPYRDTFSSEADLRAAIRCFIEAHNEHSAKPFRWNKTAESIIGSVHRAKLAAIRNLPLGTGSDPKRPVATGNKRPVADTHVLHDFAIERLSPD